MITKVHKYLILGAEEEKDSFYSQAQKEGFIEFLKVSPLPETLPDTVQMFLGALRVLRDLTPLPPHPLKKEDLRCHAERVLSLKEEIAHLEEEKRLASFEIARVSPLGHFSLEDIHYIAKETGFKLQFFCKGVTKKKKDVSPDLIYITTVHELDFFFTVSKKAETYPGFIELRIDRSLDELLALSESLDKSLKSIHEELQIYAGSRDLFQEALFQELDLYHLHYAKKDVYAPLEGSSLFAVEAWVPDSKKEKLLNLCDRNSIYVEEVSIEEGETAPTALENKGVSRQGEDLVRIFDCPSAKDKDPSLWIFWSFALFFAMIISDAGYGALFLLLALGLKWKFRTFKGSAARMYRTLVVLSCSTIIWGILTTSFFGITISEKNIMSGISPVRWLSLKKAEYHIQHKDETYREWIEEFPAAATANTSKEFFSMTTPPGKKKSLAAEEFGNNILLEFSLIVGMIHIACSFLRYLRRNWSGAGWILFLIGGYLFFPSIIGALSMVNVLMDCSQDAIAYVGKVILLSGVSLAMIFAVIQHRLSGIKEIMNLIQVFGDVLSYLRLYALGLAGMILASTWNEMGAALGPIGGAFVILAGHALNVSLCVMAGVIHGLRLNFIEWYHYSFIGEGRYFNPLKLESREE